MLQFSQKWGAMVRSGSILRVSFAVLAVALGAAAQTRIERTMPPDLLAPPSGVTPAPQVAPPAAVKAAPRLPANRAGQKAPQLPPPPPPAGAPTAATPSPLQQLPPMPPQVAYRNGMLTVDTPNSTLGDVLNAVRRETGASLDPLPAGMNERVVVRLGPAPPRDVLAELLNDTRWDYVIVGSEQDPNAVSRVILSERQPEAGGASARAVPPPGMASNPMRPQPGSEEENDAEGAQQPQIVPAGQQPMGFPTPVNPGQPPPQFPTTLPGMPPPDQQPNQPPQPQVKTPEQLLEEIKRMDAQQQQQKQQQKQQQQNPPPKPPL